MALLDLDSEMDRAVPRPAFANATEGMSWMSLWCADCVHDGDNDCPLVGVALLGRTPQAWDDVSPGALNRYVCNEFAATKDEE